jgi:hypothetical protein
MSQMYCQRVVNRWNEIIFRNVGYSYSYDLYF